MNRPLKVGFLMPYSGIYPYYAQHVMAGFFCAANTLKLSQQDFAFIPVYVGQGDAKTVVEAIQKLVFFEGVDALTGMVNIKVLDQIQPILENHGKIGLFFDMGELVPPDKGFGPNIGLISMNFWQAEFALGQWAVQEFGKDGQIVAPIYEAGFNLNAAFLAGAGSAGAERLNSLILPEAKANKDGLILDDFFAALEKDTPNYVHAIFTGKLGNDFLVQWRNSKFYDSVPLLLAENMTYEDMLEDVRHLGLTVYSSASWNRKTESRNNRDFVRTFEDFGKQQANVFGMMGYEIGLCLSSMSSYLKKGDLQKAKQHLESQGLVGPRGQVLMQSHNQERPPIDIVKIQTNENNIHQTILTQSSAIAFNTSTILEESLSGWQNPYLSV
ncbi:ABC transporter substrate-binding protein [Pedobacter sp. MW01-1-1]|uniref:ABC transporter substrate-binding protein n=1 Tax=Pedobacter sp. MW01-1-1 TaxID=3383027 RepID=UPI003FF13B01